MMKNGKFESFKYFLIIFFNLLVTSSFSQNTAISGTIIDNKTKEPLPYANAIITSYKDSTILLGAIANNKGKFLIENIPPDIYKLSISYIGYQTIHIDEIIIQENAQDFGLVKLKVLNENLDEVTIRTTKQPINYKIDRKVLDAGSFPGAIVAIDLLENVPSIQVDFNGNLTYRGDGTFKVFINGHPVANGIEKLRQIPVEKIDKIEIITNPSAKYDAEGTAGIIHVLLKRNRLSGYAINSSAQATTFGGYGWQFSVNKQDDNGSWYVEGAYSKNIWRRMNYNEQRYVKQENTTYQTYSDLKYENLGIGSYIEIGFNYDLTNSDYINFSVYANPFKSQDQRKTSGEIIDAEFNQTKKTEDYIYYNQYSCYYQYLGATFTYEHAFTKDRSNLLSTYINFSNYLLPFQEKNIDTKEYIDRTEKAGFIGKEFNEMMLEMNLSYKNQVFKKIFIETGLKTELDHIPKVISVSGKFDNDDYITPFSNAPLNEKVDFKQDVFATYLMLKSSFDKFEYQLGLRTEFTARKSDYTYINENGHNIIIPAKKHFIDLFPSVYAVCNFSEDHQLAISISSRINRPDYWSLVPISQYSTPYLYYQGNGNLMPAYSNAYEIAYKKSWGKDFVAMEIFAKNIRGVIQNYTRTDTTNVLKQTPENVGNSWSAGAEIMSGVDVFLWWNANISTSLFFYQLSINIDGINSRKEQFRSDSRLNNTFLLPKGFVFKYDLNFSSPSITAQLKKDAYFYSNCAIKKGFKDNKWQLTISYSNFFNSKKYSSLFKSKGFRINTNYSEKPMILFKVAYNFNNQK